MMLVMSIPFLELVNQLYSDTGAEKHKGSPTNSVIYAIARSFSFRDLGLTVKRPKAFLQVD